MAGRGVLLPLAAAYVREARRAHTVLSHAEWKTEPIRAGVGLRQGCAASPMIFRWVLQDLLEPLHKSWTERGLGILVDDDALTHLAWADDTWIFGSCPCDADQMLPELETEAARSTGLLIRWDKCSVADIRPNGREAVGTPPPTHVLHKMKRIADGDCVRMLGAMLQIGTKYRGEWDTTKQKCWKAFYLRRRFWKVKASRRCACCT